MHDLAFHISKTLHSYYGVPFNADQHPLSLKNEILLVSQTLFRYFDIFAFFVIITQTQILDFENVMHVLWYIIEF